MRLLLLLVVLALGADALLYNGSYTQAAWREVSVHVSPLLDSARDSVSRTGEGG
jgi:hypothetical protein